MTFFARSLRLIVSAFAASLLILVLAAPAGALVSIVGGTTVGLQPRNTTSVLDGTLELDVEGKLKELTLPETFANAAGNPVVHGSNVYVIYWDPTAHYHSYWQREIGQFLELVGDAKDSLDDVFAVNSQYTDKSNKPAYNRQTLRVASTDTHPYPSAGCTDPKPLIEAKAHKIGPITCLTDQQIRQELQSFIPQHELVTGMNAIFYVLTPPGVAVCLDAGGATGHCSTYEAVKAEEEEGKVETESYEKSFCSYHSAINPGGASTGDANTVLYAVIPWSAGGQGDGQLAAANQMSGANCQDGSFSPATEPIEQKEGIPRQQEPNQGTCPSPDGYCDRGLADLIINQIAVEQQNVVTNPLLNAWQDAGGYEATDECRNFFAPVLGGSEKSTTASEAGNLYNQEITGGHYYLNTAFSLAALRLNDPGVPCIPGIDLEPNFTPPNTVNTGEVIGLDGMESGISLNSAFGYSAGGAPQPNYATYTWDFGDGTPVVSGYAPGAPACETPWLTPCAASVFHSYQYGGAYAVTLTVTDVGGNTAQVSKLVSVNGPTKEQAEAAKAASPSSGATSPGGTTATGEAVPLPTATAAIVSRSLKSARRKGVVVRYSVNEQVAGHFEVLLSRTVAKRLGINGPLASGLPTGSAPALVIAKAVLVTTKAGHSTVSIRFSKRTAARLGRVHKVSLMLRLVVRNAAVHNPATATSISQITLKG